MVSLEVSKKNHEKLRLIRDEEKLRSFNEVLDKVLPDGVVSHMDFEKEVPAFALINSKTGNVVNILWEDLKRATLGQIWSNGEVATVIFVDEQGVLVRFVDELGAAFLNYFHFL